MIISTILISRKHTALQVAQYPLLKRFRVIIEQGRNSVLLKNGQRSSGSDVKSNKSTVLVVLVLTTPVSIIVFLRRVHDLYMFYNMHMFLHVYNLVFLHTYLVARVWTSTKTNGILNGTPACRNFAILGMSQVLTLAMKALTDYLAMVIL